MDARLGERVYSSVCLSGKRESKCVCVRPYEEPGPCVQVRLYLCVRGFRASGDVFVRAWCECDGASSLRQACSWAVGPSGEGLVGCLGESCSRLVASLWP